MSSNNTDGSSFDAEFNVVVLLPKLTKDEILYWKNKSKSQNTGLPISTDIPDIKTEPQELVQIKEERTDTLTYNCNLCDKNYADKEKVIIHKYFQHKDHLPYKCTICGEAFVLDGHLKYHQLKHVQHTQHTVPGQSAPRNNNFIGVPTICKPFKCTNCPFETKYQGEFANHQTVCIEPPDIKPNMCSLCFLQFTSKSKLNTHMGHHKLQVVNHTVVNNTPPNQTNLPCNQTLKSLRSRTSMKTTNVSNQGRAENNLKLPTTNCHWCDIMITTRNLLRHIKAKHPLAKPFKCTYCSMRFKYLSSKKVHTLKSHFTNKK